MSNVGYKYDYRESNRTCINFERGILQGVAESQVTADELYDGEFCLDEVETYELFLTMKRYYNE